MSLAQHIYEKGCKCPEPCPYHPASSMTLYDELVKLFGEHKDASYWQSVETGAVGTHVLYPTDAARFIVIVKCSCGWTSKTEPHIEHLAALTCERATSIILSRCRDAIRRKKTRMVTPETSSFSREDAEEAVDEALR